MKIKYLVLAFALSAVEANADSTLDAAIGGALSLAQLGMISVDEAVAIILPWWIGDLVALVTLAPFLIIVVERLMQLLKLPNPNVLRNLLRGTDQSLPTSNFLLKILFSLGVLALTMAGSWYFENVQALFTPYVHHLPALLTNPGGIAVQYGLAHAFSGRWVVPHTQAVLRHVGHYIAVLVASATGAVLDCVVGL